MLIINKKTAHLGSGRLGREKTSELCIYRPAAWVDAYNTVRFNRAFFISLERKKKNSGSPFFSLLGYPFCCLARLSHPVDILSKFYSQRSILLFPSCFYALFIGLQCSQQLIDTITTTTKKVVLFFFPPPDSWY